MSDALDWKKLFSEKRERSHEMQGQTRDAEMQPQISPEGDVIARNAFEADYDRIVGSSSVRRLQDKAQVYPLQQNDVVRTRLTHSIEVSAMARSLGKAVGIQIIKRKKCESFSNNDVEKLACLLQVAGLIHDLGNPPFGHYGETVIRNWFTHWFETNQLLATHNICLTEQQKNDFCYFDGNVQNLRIVSKLQVLNDVYGANFTFATLGTIMKYPWNSMERPNDSKNNGEKVKKFGYFEAEEALANNVRTELGLGYQVRHPATYLLEAADDIIYLCDDIEDGVKKGLIDWDKEYTDLRATLMEENHNYDELFSKIDSKKPDDSMDKKEQITARVRNFRNITQTFLFIKAVNAFIDNYDKIMSNTSLPGYELLENQSPLIKRLKSITIKYCFSSHEALSLELVGDKVIKSLLDIFVRAVTENDGARLSSIKTYPGKVFNLISPNFEYIAFSTCDACKNVVNGLDEEEKRAIKIDALPIYNRLLLVTDFISGMTDSYAVNLYQELMGITRPTML